MAHGGKRAGSGRKPGATLRPQFRSYFTDKEIEEVITLAKARMRANDKVLVHVVEQIFGKPTQPVEHSGELTLTDEEARQKGNAAIASVLPTGDSE